MFKAKSYVKVRSLEEAWELNQKKSGIVVGGMMWLKMENINKQTIIDLSGLKLDEIRETDELFSIGCMCTLRQLELHEGLNEYFNGVFKECTRHIVGVQFRNSATVGGSVYGRFGFSDIITCLLALDSYVELHKGGIVSLKNFVSMPYDNDILVRVIIKKDGRKAAYVTQRQTKTDFPLIACAAGKKNSRWYLSVGARPACAKLVKIDDGEDLDKLIEQAVSQYNFGTNLRGSAEYRKELTKIYLKRLMDQIREAE
ncbi:MAG: FAD binding domain-containing protein [Clostridiaceae bacterium]|nr:FAD binding domain-containing protein [Clostridiaceae bacterium]